MYNDKGRLWAITLNAQVIT